MSRRFAQHNEVLPSDFPARILEIGSPLLTHGRVFCNLLLLRAKGQSELDTLPSFLSLGLLGDVSLHTLQKADDLQF